MTKMRRITPHEIALVALCLSAAVGAEGFQEQSIDIDDRGCLTFVTLKGVRGGLTAIDALQDAGFNTQNDGNPLTAENGVRGTADGIMQSCWVKIHDIDAPLFEDEDAVAALAEPEAAPEKEKPKPGPDGGGGKKTTTKPPAKATA